MSNSEIFEAGNYRFMPGVMQYSGGVVAMPGYTIERRTFRRVVELNEGFLKIAQYLTPRWPLQIPPLMASQTPPWQDS